MTKKQIVAQKKQLSKDYPNIAKLGIPMYLEPCGYIKAADLDKVLDKKQRKTFNKFFGAQTCLLLNGDERGLYLWDCEAVLVRMFTGKLTGTQHPLLWD